MCYQSSRDQFYRGPEDLMNHETLRQPQPALHTGQQKMSTVNVFVGPRVKHLSCSLARGWGVMILAVAGSTGTWYATSLSPLTTPREKDTDPHPSRPALSIPFSVMQKLMAFLANTSLFSNHTSPSSLPLGPQPQSFARDYAKGLHKRLREEASSSNTELTHKQEHISVG